MESESDMSGIESENDNDLDSDDTLVPIGDDQMDSDSDAESPPDDQPPRHIQPVNASSDEDSDLEIKDPDDQPPDWTCDNFRDFHVPPFKGPTPGPTLPPDFDVETATPLQYFQLFFTDELFAQLVDNTNSYALWSIRQKQILDSRYQDPNWRVSGEDNTTLDELKAFMGINVIFGLNRICQYQNAFSACPFLGNQGVRNTLSQKRFEKLSQYFHVSDRSNEPAKESPNYDPLYKVRNVMEKMLELFPKLSAFRPHQCVDESMIRCKSRLSYIIFNASKPTRKGIQVFVRTDAKTGYCQQFEFYLGAKLTKSSKKGLYYDVIDRLTRSLHNTNAQVYFDNAYTSVSTLIMLQQNGVLANGTLRGLRRYNPPVFKAKKRIKMKRGESKVFQDRNNPNLTAVMWQDVKLVFFLSTLAKPHITSTTLRRFGRNTIRVSTPHAASRYHLYYKGTDFFDQLCERYDFSRRHYRSWMYLFNFLMNSAIVNSYILFKETSVVQRKKKYGQFDFRRQLALGLINNFSHRCRALQTQPLYIGPDAPLVVVNHENTHMQYSRVRTCRGHKKFEGKSKKTAYGCKACNINLCKSCHPKWHCK